MQAKCMKLTATWVSGYPMSEKLHRTREWVWRRFAHMLPRKVAYWSLIDSGIRYMGGPFNPHEVIPDVPFMTVLQRASKGSRAR